MNKITTVVASIIIAMAVVACRGMTDSDTGHLVVPGASQAQVSAMEATFLDLGIQPVSFDEEELEDEDFFVGLAIYIATDTDGNKYDFIIETETYTILAISDASGRGLIYGSLDPFFEKVQQNIDKVFDDLDIEFNLDFESLFGK